MYRHLLVLVEDTDAGIEAVGRSTEFAQGIGARITFLHASDDASAERGASHACANEALARAEAGARAQGVPCASLLLQGEALDAAIDYAQRHDCDLICVPAPHGFAALADQPRPAMLCYGTARRTTVEAPIGALLAAHRDLLATLRAALDALRSDERGQYCNEYRSEYPSAHRNEHRSENFIEQFSEQFGEQFGEPRIDAQRQALRDTVGALRELPARGFRAKTKASLLRRLRKRTSAINAELDELERLHRRDDELLDELSRLAARHACGDEAPQRLREALSAYADFVTEWMGREQGVLLPAARRYLSDADWSALDAELRGAPQAGATGRSHA